MIRRRDLLIAASALTAAPLASFAQQGRKVRRIGFLALGVSAGARLLPDSLRKLGYEEGRNLAIEWRFAEGYPERLPQLAEELVRLDVELIVANLNTASDAALRATHRIPIVMLSNMFPVERGLIRSLARPGGNVTGTVWWAQPQEMVFKIFQILKEAVPDARRSVLLSAPDAQVRFYDQQAIERAVAKIGMSYTRIEMKRPEHLETTLEKLKALRAEVFFVTAVAPVSLRWPQIIAFTIEHRLVSISEAHAYVDAGGCLSYGPDLQDVIDRTASYVDRILRGAKPGDLAVEQAHKYLTRLNAKTARAIGFKPLERFLLRVDQIVE